jgi:rhodanese-related sulfurtransferase
MGTRGAGPSLSRGCIPDSTEAVQLQPPPRAPHVTAERPGTAILAAIAEQTETSTELDPAAVAERVDSGAQLVDVRQDYEWEAGHVEGAAHIPLEQLPGRADEIDRGRPVIFGCRTGSRSFFATQAFREAGFDAYNLAGGLQAWVEDGREIEPADGEVAGPRPDAT